MMLKRIFLILSLVVLGLSASARTNVVTMDQVNVTYTEVAAFNPRTLVVVYLPPAKDKMSPVFDRFPEYQKGMDLLPDTLRADSLLSAARTLRMSDYEQLAITQDDVREFHRFLIEEVAADSAYLASWLHPYTLDQVLEASQNLYLLNAQQIINALQQVTKGHPANEFAVTLFFSDDTELVIGPFFGYADMPWGMTVEGELVVVSPQAAMEFLRRFNFQDAYFGWDKNTLLLDLTLSRCESVFGK